MVIIAVVHLKGGTTKTTTTGFLLHVLQESGLTAIGVDADGENEGLSYWQEAADWSIPVVGMAVSNLHKQLPGVVGDRYDAVVIDTPPMTAQRGTVISALRIATHVLIPLAPTPADHKELPKVLRVLEDAADLRDDRPQVAVLLTKCPGAAASPATYRSLIEDDGTTVLRAQIPRHERYAQAYGDPVRHALKTPYADAVDELLSLGGGGS